MPLGPGVKYRMKPIAGGGYERLAFKNGTVIEAKNMKTGKVHTPAEFRADRLKSHMPKGASLTPKGDLGARRGREADSVVGRFKAKGRYMEAAGYFKRG